MISVTAASKKTRCRRSTDAREQARATGGQIAATNRTDTRSGTWYGENRRRRISIRPQRRKCSTRFSIPVIGRSRQSAHRRGFPFRSSASFERNQLRYHTSPVPIVHHKHKESTAMIHHFIEIPLSVSSWLPASHKAARTPDLYKNSTALIKNHHCTRGTVPARPFPTLTRSQPRGEPQAGLPKVIEMDRGRDSPAVRCLEIVHIAVP